MSCVLHKKIKSCPGIILFKGNKCKGCVWEIKPDRKPKKTPILKGQIEFGGKIIK